MGKRNKDVSIGGRRRPMIQLGRKSAGVGVVSRNQINEEEQENISEDSSSAFQNNKSDAMETELAGFLAEINSLEAPLHEEPTGKNTEVIKTTNKEDLLYDPTTFDPATQGHLLPQPWSACYDESTSYYYYWNTETNEVQWFPPVCTVPPPPPPSENEIDTVTTTTDNKINDEGSVGVDKVVKEEKKESEKLNKVTMQSVDANLSSNNSKLNLAGYNSSSEEEDSLSTKETSSKEKDKELMNKIKEKIQKKKEEKLQKEKNEKLQREKEETEKKIEEEEILQNQKSKEEMLREKLIRKKLEREKNKSVENKTETSKEETSKSDSELLNMKNNENTSFTVDIFALDDSNVGLYETKVEKGKTPEVALENVSSMSKLNINNNKVERTSSNSCEDVPRKDNKGGAWRIIDAVYDDDDDDNNDEDEESEESEKSENEMDDYAEMLLEGAIGKKEKSKNKKKAIDISTEPTAPPDIPPPPPSEDVRPPLPPEDEPLPELPKVSHQEEEKNRKEIGCLSTMLFEKLDFLGISSKDLRNLQLYFIELETRMRDWQAGALDSKYFLERLQELNIQLLKHEETASPSGWICHWSSNFKMYYYHNVESGESQWDYPDQQSVAIQPPDYHMLQPMNHYVEPAVQTQAVDNLLTMSANAASLVSPAHGFSRDPIPTVNKKRTASAEITSDPYRDPYRSVKRKKDTSQIQDISKPDDGSQYSGTESGTSSPVPKSVIAAAPVIRDIAREASPALRATPPPSLEEWHEGSFSPQPALKMDTTASLSAKNLKPKTKKKKKVDSGGLPTKKLNHVSSLVQKWQTVKQKVEEEENIEEESEDDDYETASAKRIEEWKKDMEASGERNYNPNFTEINGDWRERLKRKSAT